MLADTINLGLLTPQVSRTLTIDLCAAESLSLGKEEVRVERASSNCQAPFITIRVWAGWAGPSDLHFAGKEATGMWVRLL